MAVHPYPVRVDAILDEPRLSRWLWLVKWVLVIPHVLVLAVLWPVFAVLSAVALVMILATGRYPRSIFDLNVGVLRWSWRVAFYTAGGFATDRYPPFTLEDRADYPAHLEVEYPVELSRGLALVKWWLLAIPHYLVLGFLVGGGTFAVTSTGGDSGWGGGLVTLLAIVAAVVLLVTGRYPRAVFDLVLGLDRWVLRVAAYAALMTDDYPPFRLDQGGDDPGTVILRTAGADPRTAVPSALTAPGPEQHPAGPRGAGRIAVVVAGSLGALAGLAALVGGGGLAVVDGLARGADGFVMSEPVTVSSPGYAVLTDDLEIHGDGFVADLPERALGTVRVDSRDVSGHDTFVGIADSADVDRYLSGVGRSMVVDGEGEWPQYDVTAGSAPSAPPAEQDFWLASAQGPGTQTVEWVPTTGSWTLVVMTAEAAAPSVAAEVSFGATVPGLDDLAWGLVIGGLVLLVAAGVTLAVGLERPSSNV